MENEEGKTRTRKEFKTVRDAHLEMEILKKLRVKMIKSFMEIFILAQLRKNAMSGYDIIASIHEKFGIMVSSSTVYSCMYRMERNGLIEGNTDEKKRIYMLTEKGEKTNSKGC